MPSALSADPGVLEPRLTRLVGAATLVDTSAFAATVRRLS